MPADEAQDAPRLSKLRPVGELQHRGGGPRSRVLHLAPLRKGNALVLKVDAANGQGEANRFCPTWDSKVGKLAARQDRGRRGSGVLHPGAAAAQGEATHRVLCSLHGRRSQRRWWHQQAGDELWQRRQHARDCLWVVLDVRPRGGGGGGGGAGPPAGPGGCAGGSQGACRRGGARGGAHRQPRRAAAGECQAEPGGEVEGRGPHLTAGRARGAVRLCRGASPRARRRGRKGDAAAAAAGERSAGAARPAAGRVEGERRGAAIPARGP
mmetsp:Transcript_15494/g.51560  ORF Transcript_15494/g.51560 Transcript_15494/m.51560 type:complete len:267 (-) Transcript_15494:153-953(-)